MADQLTPRELLFIPEAGADPVWTADGAEMVALESLPISDDLRSDLRDWSRRWEGLLYQREGTESGASDGDAAGAGDESKGVHESDGNALAGRLREELGDGWTVTVRAPSADERPPA